MDYDKKKICHNWNANKIKSLKNWGNANRIESLKKCGYYGQSLVVYDYRNQAPDPLPHNQA